MASGLGYASGSAKASGLGYASGSANGKAETRAKKATQSKARATNWGREDKVRSEARVLAGEERDWVRVCEGETTRDMAGEIAWMGAAG